MLVGILDEVRPRNRLLRGVCSCQANTRCCQGQQENASACPTTPHYLLPIFVVSPAQLAYHAFDFPTFNFRVEASRSFQFLWRSSTINNVAPRGIFNSLRSKASGTPGVRWQREYPFNLAS